MFRNAAAAIYRDKINNRNRHGLEPREQAEQVSYASFPQNAELLQYQMPLIITLFPAQFLMS